MINNIIRLIDLDLTLFETRQNRKIIFKIYNVYFIDLKWQQLLIKYYCFEK